MAVQVDQQGAVPLGLSETQLERLLDPGVENIVDLLSLLAQSLDSHLTDVPVTLHLTAVDQTLDHVRPPALRAQQLLELPGDDLGAGVPGVGEGGELRGALPGLYGVARLTEKVPGRRGVGAQGAAVRDADHLV